jgi:hypothetical protein
MLICATRKPTLSFTAWRGRQFVLVLLLTFLAFALPDEELYKLLGVKKTATTKEIKTAYRKAARDTHPDKNKGVPPEVAAEAFRKVVYAFEILSDDTSRQRYDRTGKTDSAGYGNSQGGGNQGYQQQWTWNFYTRPMKLKDQYKVQESMSRVLHIVSLEQLRTIMLDDDDKLERNMLMVFVTPSLEKHLDDEMVYPYPFAAMSNQGIWWEDLLQCVKIRYHKGNDLTRFFSLPSGDELTKGGKPLFLYLRKGDPLYKYQMFQTNSRQAFETWVWEMVQVQVTFHNQHDHPVELYWIHGNVANSRAIIQPGETVMETSMLTHEYYARDKRTDSWPESPGAYKLTTEASLGSWKIGKEGGPPIQDDFTMNIYIPLKQCFDLSGHCTFWKQLGECKKYPEFMAEKCQLTCSFCDPNMDKERIKLSRSLGHEEL